jgi:glycosyltransferase involved in cell wall biosynthesis
MACGTPVVAVREGGYRETIVDGYTGYLVERDPRQIADRIVELTTNKSLYEQMTINCGKHIKEHWDWNVREAALLNALKSEKSGK